MADNYMLFSSTVDNLTNAEAAWLKGVLQVGAKQKAFLKKFSEELGSGADSFPQFNWDISGADKHFWFYSEDDGDVYHAACLLQAFLKKFRPKEKIGFEYCCTCSKPRVGEFWGGAVVVSAKCIQNVNLCGIMAKMLR